MLKKLSTSERRSVREVVIQELKKYRSFKEIGLAENESFCNRIESLTERLPDLERYLIQERYMCSESDYMTDYHFYNFKFNTPMSHVTFTKIKDNAMVKIALALELDCGFDLENKYLGRKK